MSLEKSSNSVNFERLTVMARHQALWFTWKGDQKMAITMLDSFKRTQGDQNEKRILNAKIPVVELFLNQTQIKLAKMGECEGQLSKVDFQQSGEHVCKTCHAPAKRVTNSASPGTWILTCVEKDEKGKIGADATRRNLNTTLAIGIVKNIKSKTAFKTIIAFSLKHCLEVILEHSFLNLYWKNRPTPPMTECLIDDAVHSFVDAINCDRFEPYEWAKSCTTILEEMMVKHCKEELLEAIITDVGQLFQKAFECQIIQSIQRFEKVPQYADRGDRVSMYQLSAVLTTMTVAPSVVSHFLFKWKTKTDFDKKKALSLSFSDFLAATKKVYNGYSKKDLPLCAKEDNYLAQSPTVYNTRDCTCEDLAKFQDYVVELLSGVQNPVSFLSCSVEGSITLSAALFMDNCEELIKDMIFCHDIICL